MAHIGGCQNYGLFLGVPYISGAVVHILGIQKGTVTLTTTHIYLLETCNLYFFTIPQNPTLDPKDIEF